MQIKAVKLYENGFMTRPFALGGEDGVDKFENIKYRSSLQNYLIDTGKEVILVDTGMPIETPDFVVDEKTTIYNIISHGKSSKKTSHNEIFLQQKRAKRKILTNFVPRRRLTNGKL